MRAGMLGSSPLLAPALLSLSLAACGGAGAAPVSPSNGGPPPGDAALPRRIPIRLVHYVPCGCGEACRGTCDDAPTAAELEMSLAAANETFEAAGVSFYMRPEATRDPRDARAASWGKLGRASYGGDPMSEA